MVGKMETPNLLEGKSSRISSVIQCVGYGRKRGVVKLVINQDVGANEGEGKKFQREDVSLRCL